MDSQVEALEEKVKSLLDQLQVECAIFERLVYKNKNQHRRSSYFQYLLKVRRDLRLLKSAKLGELLDSCFQVITGNRPNQKVHLLESLKRRKCDGGKHNFMERLMGAARLLSQMVEPLLRAAIEVSTLLARSFFMGFSLTILALLARLRVLVQQILLDVVSVFNTVSSLSQKKQSVKITQERIEVYREFYPTNEEYVTLECVWNTDKFILHERSHKSEIGSQGGEGENNFPIGDSAVRYQSIESFLGDDELESEKADADHMTTEGPTSITELESEKADADHMTTGGSTSITEDKTDLFAGPSIESDDGKQKKAESGGKRVDVSATSSGIPGPKLTPKDGLLATSTSSLSSNPSKVMSSSRKVAFVSIKRLAPSTSNSLELNCKENENKSDEEEDKFYNLLTGGSLKDSLF
ncbi:hypothetical protein Dsin_023006 [Dipteronia sinensis]|uniref:Nucleolus and neural progenitor protein-like N-terminal domain-containing protein n=1 Tax=Dipteronia sinensis TaxID=43782 RepID=A0AAE0A3Y5_9ROSI|nr:hypothetical protein Dsin_023006 [Dipteronia sinensis]